MKLNKFLSIAALLSCLVVTSCGPKQQPNEGGNNDQGNGSETEGNGGDNNSGFEDFVPPDTGAYYAAITESQSGDELLKALHDIVSKRNDLGYGGLLSNYAYTDIKKDGTIKDIYSNTTHYKPSQSGSSATAEGKGYNREHAIPQSWWGGTKSEQRNDPFIVFPSDIHCNSVRGSYAYGECETVDWTSNGGYCKRGKATINKKRETVFEPNDEVKGDMARVYFYALTCYNAKNWTDGASASLVFNPNGKFGLTPYAVDLFTKWHEQDQPDEWEIQRNQRVQDKYGNRNPYVDHPEWVAKIWGN